MTASSSSTASTVTLYRYDLTQGMARSMGSMLIGRPLEGIWHTSIVVFGKEYYFDGGVGIMADANPGRTRFGTPYRTEVLGQTTKRHDEFFAWTERQRTSGFGPNDYHLLNNNCNSFTDAASMFLLGRHIPQDIREMIPTLLSTPIGQMLLPMLEQATSGGAGTIGGGGTGQAASPLLATPRQPTSSSSLSSAAVVTRTDTCVGLLSPHNTVTEEDEEELMLAQAMLESNETIADGPRSPPEAFERTISGLTLLQTVVANIREHPTEAKYRALSMESNAYKTKLKPLEPYGVTEVLRIAGFVRRPHSSGNGGEQWFLADTEGSAAVLQRVAEMLALTISRIEGAAADASKERAKASLKANAPCSSTEAKREEEEVTMKHNILKTPPVPSFSTPELKPPDTSSADVKKTSPVLRYCYPPFPKEWTPLSVGWEGGAPLFSIHCLSSSNGGSAEGPYCFGKCRLSPNQAHMQAHYCSSNGREVEVRGGYEVLCVQRGQENSVTWVPARLACSTTAGGAAAASTQSFIFCGYGRFGVARAEHGSGVQPGVMEPSGRCVISYGGRAVVVTDKAEVLCETVRLPPTLAATLRELEKGTHLSQLLRAASGQPIGSFDELLNKWRPPRFYVKPQSLQSCTRLAASAVDWGDHNSHSSPPRKASMEQEHHDSDDGKTAQRSPTSPFAKSTTSQTRLLVCHDFGGGYTAGERQLYMLEEGESAAHAHTGAGTPQTLLSTIESTYTVGYWDRTDCFVYFSHQRISVPPREWIHDGHRHGVAVLGTIITEGAGGATDLEVLLSDAKRMAAIIERLVQLCDVYGFDGYLLNVENHLPANMAKRLVVFCTQLRKQLSRKSSLNSARLVIWYDAMTIEGSLAYQNALTARNKPFFDVCDGLFTNYFWNPMHIALSRTTAGPRGADVYVGVDVFGRNMFGGGGYNTFVAAAEATRADLSVALFAPGWTMECESKGTRDGFELAESRMWSRLQDKFAYHTRLLSCGAIKADCGALCAWTAFQSGVGYNFYVNGHCITTTVSEALQAPKCTTSGWCELSHAHALPPFLYESTESSSTTGSNMNADPFSALGPNDKLPSPFAALPFRLPAFSLRGSMYGDTVHAAWRYDKAWFGDRCLSCFLPSMQAAEVLRWFVRNALPARVPVCEENEEYAGTPRSFPSLHIELMLDQSEVVTTPSGRGGRGGCAASKESVETHRGLRLEFYSASRGPLHAVIWEKTARQLSAMPVAVAGLDGVQVRVTVSHSGTSPTSSEEWCRIHYELQNTSRETLHLTSVSVVNGDASRSLQLCVGAVAVYQAPVQQLLHAAENEEDVPPDGSVLGAAGPRVWTAHTTYQTNKSGEQVLSLNGADDVLAEVCSKHGVQSTLVLFASIISSVATRAAANNDEGKKTHTAQSDRVRIGGHQMYLGQYSADPADGAAYNGSLLIQLSLPADYEVAQVSYYIVHSGC